MTNMKIVAASLLSAAIAFSISLYWNDSAVEVVINKNDLEEVANGDAQFWLMQGAPNNRYIPCTVNYRFDRALDETIVRARLKDLTSSYGMFQRNVVELNGLPYWQAVEIDWDENFRLLESDENIESLILLAEKQVSQASEPGEGLPLFRAYLTSDQKQLIFVWHHVISDLEGMFNKHAKHLFVETAERTQFGYQIASNKVAESDGSNNAVKMPEGAVLDALKDSKPIGFTETGFEVTKIVLPVADKALYAMGQRANLPMSDIFSFIALRAVTRYEEGLGDSSEVRIRPLLSPISLRKSALALDEGNNRAIRTFPFVFPLESVAAMHQRMSALEPTSNSYDTAGKMMKIARRFSFLEPMLRSIGMPDYISNYFPLADIPLTLGEAKLIKHDLRVPMVPYERTKFAWSNYNGEVQLYLHTDPLLIDKQGMIDAYQLASTEILEYLE